MLVIWCGFFYVRIITFKGVPSSEADFRADTGVVLGSKLWGDQPSPALRERLDYALTLYHAGKFEHFIVSGGLDAGGATLTEAEGMRNYLVAHGVPEERIALESESTSTYENLLFSREIMDDQGWRTAVIVTHLYHGSRTADIAAKLGYEPVAVQGTVSQVLNMAYHESREVLAYTKWMLQKLFL